MCRTQQLVLVVPAGAQSLCLCLTVRSRSHSLHWGCGRGCYLGASLHAPKVQHCQSTSTSDSNCVDLASCGVRNGRYWARQAAAAASSSRTRSRIASSSRSPVVPPCLRARVLSDILAKTADPIHNTQEPEA